MANSFIYIFCTMLSVYAVSAINFNNFFKKNHIKEAKLFVIIISLIMGYLLGSFIIAFLSTSSIF